MLRTVLRTLLRTLLPTLFSPARHAGTVQLAELQQPRPTMAPLRDLLKPSAFYHHNPTPPGMQASNSSPGASGASGGEIASMQDYEQYPRAFVVRRLFVFVGIVIG